MADRHLIDKCLNGDSSAFGMLVDKYRESVYALAYSKLRNFHDAEDITQEAFIKAYKNLHKLRTWDDFHAWIYAIASNLCKNWIRDKSRRPDSEFIEDQTARSLSRYSSESLYENAIIEQLHESLDSLPEIYQQVLTLYYLGGMDSIEIAEFLGMSPTSIYQRLSRARSLLKKEMLDMMSETFEQNRLKVGFTFRIAEMVKRIKINPVSPKTLPWGFSLATGLVLAVLSIGTHLNPINLADSISGLPLSGESKVQRIGEFPVDIMKVSSVSVISNQQWNGNGLGSIVPSMQNAFFMAPQAGDTWTKKADMPTGRWLLSTNVLDGKIYAVGGYTGAEFTTRLDVYDPITNVWTRKSDFPIQIQGGSASATNGKIYVIGGMISGGIITTKVHEYDPDRDFWTSKADMPTARWGLSTATVNGKIYAIGGGTSLAWVGAVCFPGNTISSVEEYDPIADTWIKKGDMPVATNSPACAVVNDKIYVIGGEDDDQDRTFSNVWEFDPAKDIWTKKADMPTARAMLTAEAINGKIYAIGGGKSVAQPWKMYSIVEEYDPVTDKWTGKADMPTPRSALSSSVVYGKIYAFGGATEALNSLSTVEEYDPGTSEGVNFKGKLPTTWGETKTALNR